MIKKLLRSLARLAPGHKAGHGRALKHDPSIYKGSRVGIDRRMVSSAAVRTVEGLQHAGFKAFVVGGGVRDLMLGLRPKDFDVATDATPEEVQRIFRRARLIGRRFRIVHVMFGPETIEVSTFRALAHENQETDAHGRVLRDNTFGEQHEDASRRDFTINALYYDPLSDTVLDYHHGVKDIQARCLRMIGQPEQRYREDPVRMLRVLRFQAKLGFKVDDKTLAPIRGLAALLENVPEARLFDEIVKMLCSGAALRALEGLTDFGLHRHCLPMLEMVLDPSNKGADREAALSFVRLALAKTDERIAQAKPISIGFLFASLLWPAIRFEWRRLESGGVKPVPALHEAIEEIVEVQNAGYSVQKRILSDARELWLMQPRFEKRGGGAAFRLLENPRFRAGFDFLLLRVEAGELDSDLGQWWIAFESTDSHDERLTLIADLAHSSSGGAGPRRRRRRSRRPEAASAQ